jgi:hypothetical protein
VRPAGTVASVSAAGRVHDGALPHAGRRVRAGERCSQHRPGIVFDPLIRSPLTPVYPAASSQQSAPFHRLQRRWNGVGWDASWDTRGTHLSRAMTSPGINGTAFEGRSPRLPCRGRRARPHLT